ncbi:hypothetical protein J4441_00020 [Candidatus Micrarchaeota archaeon]|nr:hypothetical protein [Candidatus Micrarchaeota archaeon]
MVKALPPKELPNLRTKIVNWLTAIVVIIFVLLLIVSAVTIILQYGRIVLGIMLDDIQKMGLDYSLTIFAGSAIFLLLYRYKFEDSVRELLGIKKVKLLKHKEIEGNST